MAKRITAPLNPGWIKSIISNEYDDAELHKIVLFYVIHTPCELISYSSIPLTYYGWNEDVWRKGILKKELFKIANLEKDKNYFSVQRTDEIRDMLNQAKMQSDFQQEWNEEKIAIYKPNRYNDFTGILYHIRNSLAHGRFTIYPAQKPDNPDEIYFVMEDGVKKGDKFFVRARMVLKRKTLLDWIDIIEHKAKDFQEVE